jgi:hypothetical protein
MADAEIPQTQKESDEMSIIPDRWSKGLNVRNNGTRNYDGNTGETIPTVEQSRPRLPPAPTLNPLAGIDRHWQVMSDRLDVVEEINKRQQDEISALVAENDSLRRENTEKGDEIAELRRENRILGRHAQSLSTWINAISGSCAAAMREALHDAHEEAKKEPPQDDPVPAFLTAEMPSQTEG